MIPLRDINPTHSRPVLTYLLIAANVAVFVYQLTLGEGAVQELVERFGVVPYFLTEGDHLRPRGMGGALGSLITPFTSMFMHGGFLHLIGNMWFLHVFGDNVEDRLGSVRYLAFYFLCGIAAVAAQVIVDPDSHVPMIGASGAIAGILGGYVSVFPRARVLTVVPIFIFLQFVELPAFFFVFVWFGMQLLLSLKVLSVMDEAVGGVAVFAHIGGCIAGFVLIRMLGRRRQENEQYGRFPSARF